MNARRISKVITDDIKSGVYDSFPKLKERLKYIAGKLVMACYIENFELSRGEIKTLEENEYI